MVCSSVAAICPEAEGVECSQHEEKRDINDAASSTNCRYAACKREEQIGRDKEEIARIEKRPQKNGCDGQYGEGHECLQQNEALNAGK